jgi:hypothetical protein
MLSEIINTENVGTMDHENPIVIHVISCTFGGFVRIVHSSSCSDKAMSGLLRTSNIFLCHTGDLFHRLEFMTTTSGFVYMQQIRFISVLCKQTA